jgi:signal transduction histidine kinase
MWRPRRWRDWPWASKLAILLTALAVVPLAVMVLYHGAVTRNELLAATRAQNLQQARSTAQAIERYLDGILADLRLAALSPLTVRYLAAAADGGGPTQGAEGGARATLADATRALGQAAELQGFDAISLTDRGGDVLLSTSPALQGRSYLTSKAFLDAVNGRSGFGEPRADPVDGRIFIHASAPVRRPDGEIVGVAIGRANLAALDSLVAADSNFAGRGEFGVLWDDRGIRLSQPAAPQLRFRPLAPLLEPEVQALAMDQRFGPRTRRLLTAPVVIEGLAEPSRWRFYDQDKGATLSARDARQGRLDAAVIPLRGKRWLYGVFTPEAGTLAALLRQTRRSLALALLTGALAMVLAVVAARWATGPLRLVRQTAQAIAAGDVSRRVGLHQGDEVGELAAAFDAMAAAVERQGDELRRHAEELEQTVEARTAALRASEAELRVLYAQAEEANRLKDEFLSTVSHELRTPLNAILGWTWLLAGGSLDRKGTERAIATVERNARAQGQIIDDLLDVSRIVTGKLLLTRRPVDLAEVIEATLDTVRPAADAKGIRLDLRLGAAPVLGDAARLQQVSWNLLSNAVKFTPVGGRVEVVVEPLQEAGAQGAKTVELRVSDSGSGIPAAFLPHVFDRFRQADSSSTRAHGGLGLGLAIVRHLIELHGGTVRAESPGEGQGATFRVHLPAAPAAEPSASHEAAPGKHVAADALRGLRVLVVDDEPDARDVIAVVLGRYGAEVQACDSADQGLALLESTSPDLLVADLGMPGRDGYDLIHDIRNGPHAHLPALALSAYAGEADRRRALAAGFQVHLAKPAAPEDLAAAVARLAGRD